MNGDGAILGNMSEQNENQYKNGAYENVKHGFLNRPRAPTPPSGEWFHNI